MSIMAAEQVVTCLLQFKAAFGPRAPLFLEHDLSSPLNSNPNAQVGVVMGSSSDWETMKQAAEILTEFGIPFEARVVSAHRMPDEMFAYAEAAAGRGLKAIIAGAGGAAHLPGMLAAKTPVPVLGVPVASRHLQGVDSLHSIVQMPKGIPVATFAIGTAGAANAALFAVAMLANENPELRARLEAFRAKQTEVARGMSEALV
jgi:5-(carboxyamino)imidazole ribonucleotide mutase